MFRVRYDSASYVVLLTLLIYYNRIYWILPEYWNRPLSGRLIFFCYVYLSVSDNISEDTVVHIVTVCPAWAEHRRVLVEAIGGGELSRPALLQAMVRSERGWEAVTSFCKAVVLEMEVAGRQRCSTSRPSRCGRRSGRREPRDDFRPS